MDHLPTLKTSSLAEAATSSGLRAAAAAANTTGSDGAWGHIEDSVQDTAEDWSLAGRKLGVLAAATAVLYEAPMFIITHLPTGAGVGGMLVGAALGTPLGTAAALIGTALEERYIGIGKHAGQLLGYGAGSAAGLAKGAVEAALGHTQDSTSEPAPYELEKRAPRGTSPKEPLLPKLLHLVETKVLGHVPERSQAAEISEGVGILVAQSLGAIAVPTMLAGAVGGPIGFLATTLIGPLTALVLMGVEENSIGAGRFVGEIVGDVIHAVHKGAAHSRGAALVGPPMTYQHSSTSKKFWNGFMHGMGKMAEPIISYLLDASELSNNLFREKPYQTMNFTQRPDPKVDKDRLLQNFIKLAGIPGVNPNENKVGAELSSQLAALGIPFTSTADGTVIATVPGTVPDAPTVVLSAHQDTVDDTSDKAIRVSKRRVYTDGRHILGGDDRAGCAEILEGVRCVLEQKLDHPEIKIVFTTGEEVGLHGAAALHPDDISKRPALGYVCDSTDVGGLYLANDAIIVTPNSVKYNFSPESPLVQVALKSMANAGTPIKLFHSGVMAGAGTDANTPGFNRGHIISMAVGAGERDIHTVNENIKIADLIQGAKHVVGYITNTCDLKVDGDQIVPRSPIQ